MAFTHVFTDLTCIFQTDKTMSPTHKGQNPYINHEGNIIPDSKISDSLWDGDFPVQNTADIVMTWRGTTSFPALLHSRVMSLYLCTPQRLNPHNWWLSEVPLCSYLIQNWDSVAQRVGQILFYDTVGIYSLNRICSNSWCQCRFSNIINKKISCARKLNKQRKK